MAAEHVIGEIRETNLTYLMLAQQMLREDREVAMCQLGIGGDVADVMMKLTSAQIARMASCNMLLCRFRCDDRLLTELLSGYGKNAAMAPTHAAILMNNRTPERIS